MATDPFAGIVARLQAALLAESARMNRLPVIVAALDIQTLRDYWASRPQEGVTFASFEGRDDAHVQAGPCGASLWLDPTADGYRALYGRFLKAHWGAGSDLTGSGYDADHVYNRARAIQYGYRVVRMMLVRAGPNRAHGSGYEKPLGAVEKTRFVKIMKLLDGMSELKMLGLPPVRGGLLTAEHRQAATLAAQHYGIPVEAALNTLLEMYGRAHPED
jgi:hypothetical protein